MKNEEFDPIGFAQRDGLYFKGIFDGDNFTIRNFKFYYSSDNSKSGGIFDSTDSALLKNIRILNADVVRNWYAGALVGYSYNNIEIINCSVTGKGQIVGGEDVGGLIGSTGGIVKACYSTLNVDGSYAGGLIGSSSNDVLGSYATGNVYAIVGGGLIESGGSSRISECYAIGDVVSIFGGGLVGMFNDAKINNCFSVDNVSNHVLGENESIDEIYYILLRNLLL